MPDLSVEVWLLIGAAVLVAILVLIGASTRRGREQAVQEQEIRRSQTWRVVSALVLLGLIVLFAVLNSHMVRIDWLFTTVSTPMIVVIGLSGLVGYLIGLLTAGRDREKRSP